MTKKLKEENNLQTLKSDEEFSFPKELQVFLEAGVHFGHKKSMVHPRMLPYIFGVRNNVHIIDVAKTKEKLEESLKYLKTMVDANKVVLFVGTKPPLKEMTKETAEAVGMPYVVNRWFGGTITNWSTIKERIDYFKELKEKTKSEDWEKYTKHERLKMKKEIEKLEENLGGIQNMAKLPDLLFVTDSKENALAIKEAKMKNIPVVGIVDTNVNPEDLTYPIPANDDSIASVKLVLDKIEEALLAGGKTKPTATAKTDKGAKKSDETTKEKAKK